MNQLKEEHIFQKLKSVREASLANEQAIQKNMACTEHVHHLRQKSEGLFNQLLENWRDDKTFTHIIQQHKFDVQHHESQLSKQLTHEHSTLIKERQSFIQEEDNLYHKHRILRQEEPR